MRTRHLRTRLALSCIGALVALPMFGIYAQDDDLAKKLRELDPRILTADKGQAKIAAGMLSADVRARIKLANQRETKNWRGLKNLADWEKYRDDRIAALRKSLGKFPAAPAQPKVTVTKIMSGDDYQIKNVVFETRPGFYVTANLYVPNKQPEHMPGIIIVHSHHNPKTEGELQDMGALWARLGCAVLVPDQVGHGERRQHPFATAKDYAKPFKVGRQDYYFRYNVNEQLNLIGDSLMGWMAWDLMRGVDVLLAQPNIDKKAIILMGAVAGGGDPCAVTAALDKRITAAVPFNFGGPQPETTFPLPADPEDAFNYAGGGSWESTRNLKLSARDGFLPWVIVGATAPRGLIYAHEFTWDKDRDPVWKRLVQIYKWYNATDHLAATYGKGSVKGASGPNNTHCNNIGAVHRVMIYPALEQWFNIPVPKAEFKERHTAAELACLTSDLAKVNQPVYKLAHAEALNQIAAARQQLSKLSQAKRVEKMRKEWDQLLGGIGPITTPQKVEIKESRKLEGVEVQSLAIPTERDILVPALLLIPTSKDKKSMPVVVGVAQHGHAAFLKHRSAEIAELLKKGVAVCLPDVRGTGETQSGGRGRASSSTSISATELMLGKTILGGQCHDLLTVLQFLRTQPKFNPDRIALWGDSFVPVNDAKRNLAVPLDADDTPDQGEPTGANLALLGALFDGKISAVYARAGLGSYLSALQSQFFYLPHDAIIPGAVAAGDVCDLAGTLAPRPLWLDGMIDGVNQPFALTGTQQPFAPATAAYQAAQAAKQLRLTDTPVSGVAAWLIEKL